MTSWYQTLSVHADHPLPVGSGLDDGSVTVTVLTGGTVYYADNVQVSAASNQGSLAAGQSATFTLPQWLRSASLSDVSVLQSAPTIGIDELPSSVATGAALGGTSLQKTVDLPAWAAAATNPLFVAATGSTSLGGTFGDCWFDGSTFHFYGMVDGSSPGIWHWTSADGLTNWTADPGNPVIPLGAGGTYDATTAGVPCVWSEGSTVFMLYRAQNGAATTIALATASTSTPGTWTKYGSNPVYTGTGNFGNCEAGPGRVIKVGSTYYMWISTISGYNRWCGCVTASSPQGPWTLSGANPIFSGGRFCNCIWTDGAFYYSLMPHYTGYNSSAELELWRSTSPLFPGYARDYLGVVRRIATGNSWEGKEMDTPTVMTDTIQRNSFACTGGSPRIYFAGQSSVSSKWLSGALTLQAAHSPATIDRKAITLAGQWIFDTVPANLAATQLAFNGSLHNFLTFPTSATAVSIALWSDTTITAGSMTATLTNWLGNASYSLFPSQLKCTLSSGQMAGAAVEEGVQFFAPGEGIGVQLSSTAALAPATAKIQVSVGVILR